MHRLFILFPLIFHINVWAEWVGVMHKDSRVEYMVDPGRITANFGTIVMPTLLNFKDAQIGADGQPYLSELSPVEYDCGARRSRQLSIQRFSENLGGGKAVGLFDAKSDWKPFAENSHARILQTMLCKQ